MDLARLTELLDLHGPDLERFPASERSAAQALLAHDPAAQRALASAMRLSQALDALPAVQPSPALMRAVAEVPVRDPRASVSFAQSLRLLFGPLASLRSIAASAVVAMLLGALASSLAPTDPTSSDDDWTDLSAVAFATSLDEDLSP